MTRFRVWSIWTGASWSADELPVWDEVRWIHVDWCWTDHQRTFTQTLSVSKENRPCSRVWKSWSLFVCMAGFCWLWLLASCLINAQPLPAHRPAADDNSLIGCTSHDLTDDWSLASRPTHFVDSQYPFRRSFWCVLLLNQMFWKQCTVRLYHSNLSDQSALEIRVRNLGYTQSCTTLALFTKNKESEHLVFREFHGRIIHALFSQPVVSFWGQRRPDPHRSSIPGPTGVLLSPRTLICPPLEKILRMPMAHSGRFTEARDQFFLGNSAISL